jgi:hypothetical protein
MAEMTVQSLVEIRQTLIFAALREAAFYLQTVDSFNPDLVRMVVVDEAMARWFGRDMLTDAAEAATEAVHYIESVGIEELMRKKDYLP